MGDYQNYGPFLSPYYNTGPNTGPNLGDPKRDHNFDNPPGVLHMKKKLGDEGHTAATVQVLSNLLRNVTLLDVCGRESEVRGIA